LPHGRAVVVDTARRVGRRRRALNAGGIQQHKGVWKIRDIQSQD